MFDHPPVVDECTAGQLGEALLPGSSVVIVTYNSASTIAACLHSVLSTLSDGDEVIVVDNASRDGTVGEVERFLPLTGRLKLIASDTNLGFSLGCNVGMRASIGEYLVLLNPDTVVWPRWLEKMRRAFGPGVGAVGPLSDNVGAAQAVGHYLPPGFPLYELQDRVTEIYSEQGIETKLLIGFCVVLKREIMDKIGLLDENLFLGNDDLELSWRIRSHGLKLMISKDVFVHHDAHVSFRSEEPNATQQLIRESGAALNSKLGRYFKVVPSSLELWGTEFS